MADSMSVSESDTESLIVVDPEVIECESGSSDGSTVYMYEASPSGGGLELHRCLSLANVQSSAPPSRAMAKRRTRPLFESNPSSILTDVDTFRSTYNIPSSVVFRVPSGSERAYNTRPDEIVVYEAFFALGMRGAVPTLIAKVARELNISPGQFTPPTWRMLTAMQVFGELFSIRIGVDEVLFSYYFKAHDIDKHRCMIHKRTSSYSHLVHDIAKPLKGNTPYEKEWTKKFLFMQVGLDSEFPRAWYYGGFRRDICWKGKALAKKVISYPKEYRLVTLLLQPFALERSIIWGCSMSSYNGTIGNALEIFRRASQASIQAAPEPCSKDKQAAPRSSSRRPSNPSGDLCPAPKASRKSSSGAKASAGSSRSDLLVSSDHSTMISHLNETSFSRDLESYGGLGPTDAFDAIQSSLFQVLQMEKENQRLTEDNSKLKKLVASDKAAFNSSLALKDKDINQWKDKAATLTGEISSVRAAHEESQQRITRLEQKLEVAEYGAIIINTWRMVQEFMNGEWSLDVEEHRQKVRKAEEAYREVVIAQANMECRDPPTFPESLTHFGNTTLPSEGAISPLEDSTAYLGGATPSLGD